MAAYASSNTASGTGSAVVTKPTGLAAGDLMIAIVGDRGSNFETGAPSTPSGWTAIVSDTSTSANVGIAVFAKIADSSDAAATDFTFSHSNGGSGRIAAVMYRITGTLASVSNIYHSAVNVGTEPSADVFRFANGFTPETASSLLIMGAVGYSDTNNFDDSNTSAYALQTNDPTWTERADFAFSTGLAHRLSSATATRTETTATGYYQVTYTAGGSETPVDAVGVLLAVTDTANATHNATVITATANVIAPSVSGSASVTASVISAVASVQSPTVTTAAPTWSNQDKPSAGTVRNQDKP